MTTTLISRRELDFILHDWIGPPAGIDRATVDAILDLSENLAIEQFLPHYKLVDIEEPRLEEGEVKLPEQVGSALRQYAELGFFSASFADDLGGMGLPFSVGAASYAIFAAANIAIAAYPMLTVANARLIETFGSEEQVNSFALPQILGRWFGTMCLSEPQAGSSLDEVRTRAVFAGADAFGQRYRLAGNKMWISGGEHELAENIVHLVLAKIPLEDGSLPHGTAGISLFIVPRLLPDGVRNDIRVAGLNHKMGNRGTVNCLLNFGEEGGATGWLVGQPGDGLRQMFTMMNEARINVGIGAAAIASRSYHLAVRYARERVQGRAACEGRRKQVAIIEHADVKTMLLRQKTYAEGALALTLYCARLVDRADDRDSQTLLGLLTPVAKTWPSEFGLAASDIAIQVHGGYGYTREFHVEQLWRDNRLNAIHEGTTGIQAIDLLGRKILKDGRGLECLRRAIAVTIACARGRDGLRGEGLQLEQGWIAIQETVDRLASVPGDMPLANATCFLRVFGHGVLAWLWLDQAVAALKLNKDSEAERHLVEGKMRACRYFFEFELPQALSLLPALSAASDVASTAPSAIF